MSTILLTAQFQYPDIYISTHTLIVTDHTADSIISYWDHNIIYLLNSCAMWLNDTSYYQNVQTSEYEVSC